MSSIIGLMLAQELARRMGGAKKRKRRGKGVLGSIFKLPGNVLVGAGGGLESGLGLGRRKRRRGKGILGSIFKLPGNVLVGTGGGLERGLGLGRRRRRGRGFVDQVKEQAKKYQLVSKGLNEVAKRVKNDSAKRSLQTGAMLAEHMGYGRRKRRGGCAIGNCGKYGAGRRKRVGGCAIGNCGKWGAGRRRKGGYVPFYGANPSHREMFTMKF